MVTGCTPYPPVGSVSESQAKAAAIEWVSQQDHLQAWHQTVADPSTQVTVMYLQDDPATDDAASTPIWSVEFSSPRTRYDLKEPASSVTVRLRMNGSLSSFEAADAP
jgi:hypothetical protein